MRIVYPLLWSRLGREACQEQSVNTAAALARLGADITLLMPRRRGDPLLDADAFRAWFDVRGEFRVVQRPSRWAGDHILQSSLWTRRALHDPEVQRADLIYSRIPAMMGAVGVPRRPYAIDHYKPWPDRLPLLRPLMARTGRSPRCLGFILHSEHAAQSYRRLPIDPAKVLVAHNGADPERMLPRLDKADARARLRLPIDRPIAVYAGRVDATKGLGQLLLAAERRPEILFLIVGSDGDGPVERAAARLANVRVVPWQGPRELPVFLYAADILVIPPSRAPLERFGNCVLPLKLFAYLAAGRAILAPDSPDTAELLKQGHNALLVPPDDPEAAAAAIDRLVNEPALAHRLGANAAALAGGLSWDARGRRIAAFLEERLSAAQASV